jgi:RHS repeat protein
MYKWSNRMRPVSGARFPAFASIKNNTTSATLASFDLGYDVSGNVTSKASSVFANPSNTTWTYTYDGASRLTQAIGENASGAATAWDYNLTARLVHRG